MVQGFPLYLAQARQTLYQQSPSPSPSLFCTFEARAESEREQFVCGVSGYRKACAPALGRCQEEATEVSLGRKKGDLIKAYLIFFLLVYDCQLFEKHCLYEISIFAAEVVMAPSAKYLPCKHEDLSSIPSRHVKSWVWQDMLVTPALGGRHRGPWRLLDCQSQWSVPDVVKACFKN